MAFDDDYRLYREVIAASIELLRPHVEVVTSDQEELKREVARFDPKLIISSQPKMTIQPPPMAWIKVSTDGPTQPAEVWLGEDRWEASEPTIELLAQVIDGIEENLIPTEAGKKHPTHRPVSP